MKKYATLLLILQFSLFMACAAHKKAAPTPTSPNPAAPNVDPAAPTAPTTPQTLALGPTYASVAQNILVPKCTGCHGDMIAKNNIRFDTYNFTMFQVVPGSRDFSPLYQVLKANQMPLMPEPLLTADELNVLGEWIDQGALDN